MTTSKSPKTNLISEYNSVVCYLRHWLKCVFLCRKEPPEEFMKKDPKEAPKEAPKE